MQSPLSTQDWTHWSQRTRLSPFPAIISLEAMCKELGDYVGVRLSEVIVLFEDGLVHYFLPKNDRERCARALVDQLRNDPLLYHRLVDLQKMIGAQLVETAKELGRQATSDKSAMELLELYKQYECLYRPVYASYGSVWIIEDALRETILETIREKISDTTQALELLNIITMEPEAHVVSIERNDLVRLAFWIKQYRDTIPSDDIQRRIEEHRDRYFWLMRDYEDPAMTVEDINQRISQLLEESPQRQQETIKTNGQTHQQTQEAALKQLKLNDSQTALVDAMRDIARLKELRKRFVSESLCWFDPVLEEIARRLRLTIRDVRYLLTEDIERALSDPSVIDGEHITQDPVAWHVSERGARRMTPTECNMFSTLLDNHPRTWPITGLAVSPGKTRGPVRIILHPNETGKLSDGDVIVSIQVQPSFGLLLHRAAALVCDGGHGITSHPATMAREARIPAVIQTHHARHMLKDGDMVEVDGYAGTVRLVENN